MTEFDINTFYSPLTKHSPKHVSLHQIDGKFFSCSNEIELYGSGFICMAEITNGLLGVKFYKPCRMNNSQCPINQYRESPLPNP